MTHANTKSRPSRTGFTVLIGPISVYRYNIPMFRMTMASTPKTLVSLTFVLMALTSSSSGQDEPLQAGRGETWYPASRFNMKVPSYLYDTSHCELVHI